ncbi:hypothetical protein [Tabrizicola sp.]|uniref:hypothetical protein n=1 Tax=Tabrizicola sp. TaxID=2005166 RepID=UPI003D2C30C1
MAKKIENAAVYVVRDCNELKIVSLAAEGAVRVAPVYLDGERLEGVYSEVKAGSLDGMFADDAVAAKSSHVPAGIDARNSVLKTWSDSAKKSGKAQKAGLSSIMLLSLAACGGGGGSAYDVKTGAIAQSDSTVEISSALGGAVITVVDDTDGADVFTNVTVDASGSGVLTFDFEHFKDTVVLSAESRLSGFTTIEVKGGTVDFTALPDGALSGVRVIEINSGAILTYAQFEQMNSITGGVTSELTVVVDSYAEAIAVANSPDIDVNTLSIGTEDAIVVTVAQALNLAGIASFDGEFFVQDSAQNILNASPDFIEGLIDEGVEVIVTNSILTGAQVQALASLGVVLDPASYTVSDEVLTAGVDVLTANVFGSAPEYTPGGNDFVNTLQDEDELTGIGTNPTLNVTLGSVNDSAEAFINPILNNIQTINLAVTSGDIEGLGLEEATGTKAINITRISQNQTDLC